MGYPFQDNYAEWKAWFDVVGGPVKLTRRAFNVLWAKKEAHWRELSIKYAFELTRRPFSSMC